MSLATQKQISYIHSLLDERDLGELKNGMTLELLKEQATGLNREAASRWIERLKTKPLNDGATAEAEMSLMPDVAAGRYALVIDDQVQFFKVDRPKRGRWAGYTFVSSTHGGNDIPIKDARERGRILDLIAANTEVAVRRYGTLTNTCGLCGMGLTDKFSRWFGVGPVCRKNAGMPHSEADFVRRGGFLPNEYLNEASIAAAMDEEKPSSRCKNASSSKKTKNDSSHDYAVSG